MFDFAIATRAKDLKGWLRIITIQQHTHDALDKLTIWEDKREEEIENEIDDIIYNKQ